jgi:hypothetical protein
MGMCAARSGSRFLAFATVAGAVACGGDGGGAAAGDRRVRAGGVAGVQGRPP